MNLRPVLLALMASIALVAPFHASAETPPAAVTTTIGDAQIALPILPGFAAPSATPKTFVDMMARALPATNRLVAIMLRDDFMAKVQAGDVSTPLSRYMGVQTFPAYEQTGMTPALFEQVKTLFRTQSAQLLEKAKATAATGTDRLSQDVAKLTGDDSTSIRTGDGSLVGVFDEQPNSISIAALQTVSATTHAGSLQVRQVMALSSVLIHGKVLVVSVYSNYEAPADIDWAEGQVRTWVRRLNELNP